MLYISKSAVVINIIIAFLVARFSGDQTLDGKPSQESRVRALNANNSVLGILQQKLGCGLLKNCRNKLGIY